MKKTETTKIKSHFSWKTQCLADKIFDVLNFIILSSIFLVCIYPILNIILVSFSSTTVGVYLWPVNFSLEAYKKVLQTKDVWTGYANTIINTFSGVFFSLAITLPCSYALSRKDFVGRKVVMTMIVITMFISGGMIPDYLNINRFGLVNTRTIIVIMGAASAWDLIICKTFFQNSIPEELFEAAKIDGCGNGRYFIKFVLPLSKAVIAVIALNVGVAHWNSYFTEMVYLRKEALYPLSLVLRRYLWQVQALKEIMNSGNPGVQLTKDAAELARLANIMQYVLVVVSTAPIFAIYPYLQKYFAKGVMIGSVKG